MTTLDFTTIVRNQVTAIQALARTTLDFTIGSVLRAIVESNSSIVIWLQTLILQVLITTRASTSSGSDLDSWMADFGLIREPAIAATGHATFSRFTASGTANIPVGLLIETTDGVQSYIVTVDTTNANYDVTTNTYVMANNVANIILPITAIISGIGGNAVIGAINTLTTSIPGVDTVSNASALTNGIDAETDVAFRARFILFIASLSRGTFGAVAYAIISLQQGLYYTITENYDYDGTLDRGFFYAVVDDGTGSPTSDILTACTNAIELVRPLCSRFAVYAPTITDVTWTMSIEVPSSDITTKNLVQTTITNYINSLVIGQKLQYTKLIQLAYETSPNVLNVHSGYINGATYDIAPNNQHVLKVTSGTVS